MNKSFNPADIGKSKPPSKWKLQQEGWAVYDEDGKDTSHPAYGKPGYWAGKTGPWAGKKRPDFAKKMTGRSRPDFAEKMTGRAPGNWKGGISLDKKAYDAKRWAEGKTSTQRKQNEK